VEIAEGKAFEASNASNPQGLVVASSLRTLPYPFARDHGVLLLANDDGQPHVAFRVGSDKIALLEVRRFLGCSFTIEQVEPAAFDSLLSENYAMDGSAAAMAGDMALSDDGLDDIAGNIPSPQDLLDSADDEPTIRLINRMIDEAARQGASDIHIETYETGLVVRMRVDGVLTEKLRMPPHVASVIVNRIKVMARLDIAERRIPQDGRISLTLGGKRLDVRVSTLPNRTNERVVMRILDKESAGISLDLLGMSPSALSILTEALREPNGIILVTGPTEWESGV